MAGLSLLVAVLIAGLGARDHRIRDAATAALVRLNTNAVPQLQAALGHRDPEIARRAATILDRRHAPPCPDEIPFAGQWPKFERFGRLLGNERMPFVDSIPCGHPAYQWNTTIHRDGVGRAAGSCWWSFTAPHDPWPACRAAAASLLWSKLDEMTDAEFLALLKVMRARSAYYCQHWRYPAPQELEP